MFEKTDTEEIFHLTFKSMCFAEMKKIVIPL